MSKYIIGLLFLCCGAALAQSGWVRQTSPTTVNLNSVDFVNAENGVAVGAARTILRTTDGGATWMAVNAGEGIQLNAVSFANDSVGVATGYDGQILFTQNAGVNWAVIQEGWASDYHCAHQITPSVGFLMGGNAIFSPFGSRTSNAWQSHQDFAFYVQHDGSGNEGAVYGVHFFNADTGCAAVAVWDGHGAVVKTTDGGQSWATKYWTDRAAFAMDFPTPTVGYICGAGAMVARSTDAGESWTDLNSQGAESYWGIKFVNADTGWVVGDNGLIFRACLSCDSVALQASGVTTTLRSVDFVNDSVGYIVGDSGVILKTTTGGESRNHPPGAFRRVAPRDGDTLHLSGQGLITFNWTTAHDPDNDVVGYALLVQLGGFSFPFGTQDTALRISLGNPSYARVTWTVVASDGQDTTSASNGEGHFFIIGWDAVEHQTPMLRAQYALAADPNPFNPTTTLSISLPLASNVRVSIFNIEGQKVFERRFGVLSAGEHRVQFDGSQLPSGIYISRLETPRAQISRKLVLLK